MTDLLMVIIIIAFFILMCGFVLFCNSLMEK